MPQYVEKPRIRRRKGAASSEYAIVIGLIAIAVISSIGSYGGEVRALFSGSTERIALAAGADGAGDTGPAGPERTPARDTQPDPFDFEEIEGAEPGTPVASAPVTLSGFDGALRLELSGVEGAAVSVDNGAWQPRGAMIRDGARVRLRVTASDDGGAWRAVTAALGGESAQWRVRARLDRTPDAFTFQDQSGLAPDVSTTSNAITIQGLEAGAQVRLTGHPSAELRIDGSGWQTGPVTVYNDETVQLRMRTAVTGMTTRAATLDVGGVTGVWRTTTGETGPVGCDYPGDACESGMHYVGDGRYVAGSGVTGLNLTERPWDHVTHWQGAGSRSDGAANTAAYLDEDWIDNPAAEHCDRLRAHGHDDWYLPAEDEMAQAMQYASQIEMPTRKSYWTSTSLGNPTVRIFKLTWNYKVQKGAQPETDHPEFVTWCMRAGPDAGRGDDDTEEGDHEDEDGEEDEGHPGNGRGKGKGRGR